VRRWKSGELNGDDVDLRKVLAALRLAWWLPAISLLVGASAALGISLLRVPLYTSNTQFFVSAAGSTASTADAFQGSQFSQQRVTSYARVLEGRLLASRVIEQLGLDLSPSELQDRIAATAVPDTVLIDVSVTDPSPERAQLIAEALGEQFIERVDELETREDASSLVTVDVNEFPELPASPSSPQTNRNVVLGAILGLLVGAGVAVLRAQLDRSVKNTETASELTGAPVIGAVLRDQALEKRHTVDRSGTNRAAEDYRQLRNNLQFLNVDDPPKVIMISSALPSEGKTTAVVNLALALADADRSVTIVEADLRRPKVTRYMGLISGVGLTNVLAGTADLDQVVQHYGEGRLKVIAAGPLPPNPGELLASSHMAKLLDKLRGSNDFVLIDAPPLLPVADASGLAVHTDGVLLSVRYGATRQEQLQQAAATLERVGAKTLGVILNIVPPKAEAATSYGYGYGYAPPERGGV
jgi:capsular exopolysaccharide synthesis family protein